MNSSVNAIRVLVKALLLFVVLNLAYALIDPPIGKMNGYNFLWPGRVRFPYSESPSFYGMSYNASVIEDFDAMFGSHILSATPKGDDEFRVFLLGDSATWGGHVPPQEMLAEQLNRLELTTCDGRRVRVYDLGYPWPSLLRDILVLDRAKQYQPDLVVWPVTLHSFEKKAAERDFIVPHAERMRSLAETYNIELPRAYLEIPKPSLWEKTIVGQRKHIKNVLLNQVFGPLWAATGVDNHFGLVTTHGTFPQDLPADTSYLEYKSDKKRSELLESLMFDVLRAGHDIAGEIPVIVVNEPIFIITGQNSDLRYNELYPRWAYDLYRAALTDWTRLQGYVFYDYWNALPLDEFANEVFHRDPRGERRFAELIAPHILDASCK